MVPLEPIKDHDHFERTHGYLKYLRKVTSQDITEGFGEDKEAMKAAEAFLTEYFGKLSDPVFPMRIAKGKDVSSDIDGPNLLVVFETRHHGIPLDGYGAVVYFRGKIITMASIMLVSVTPVPDSEHSVISKEQAIRVWNDQAPDASSNPDPRSPKEQGGQDWTRRQELPLLRAEPLEPIKDHDHFERSHG